MIPIPSPRTSDGFVAGPVVVVGGGRMGKAVVAALEAAQVDVRGPDGRGATGDGARIVLLAVPDAAVADAARLIEVGPFVGHLSGSLGLEALSPHEGFSLHPLMTVTDHGADFTGVTAAVDATSDASRHAAEQLVAALGMAQISVDAEDRVAYHAAASIASNFLVTLEGLAEELAATAGVTREALVPLVRASVENWAVHGATGALTGPIARGDTETVARQRAAVAERIPARLALFDALVEATVDLAASRTPEEC